LLSLRRLLFFSIELFFAINVSWLFAVEKVLTAGTGS
jgi:hypothetical protein